MGVGLGVGATGAGSGFTTGFGFGAGAGAGFDVGFTLELDLLNNQSVNAPQRSSVFSASRNLLYFEVCFLTFALTLFHVAA